MSNVLSEEKKQQVIALGKLGWLMVKKVVRRAEANGHRHGFRVSGVLLIEAADNPRPVHKLCHQTQHPKQDPVWSRNSSWPLPGARNHSSAHVMINQAREVFCQRRFPPSLIYQYMLLIFADLH